MDELDSGLDLSKSFKNDPQKILETMKMKDDFINELHEQLEQEQKENSELRKKLGEKLRMFDELSEDEGDKRNGKHTETIEEKQKLIEENTSLKSKILELEKQINNSKQISDIEAIYNKRIEFLKLNNDSLENRNKELEEEINQKDKTITELNINLKQFEKDLKLKNSSKDNQFEKTSEQLKFANDTISRLNSQIENNSKTTNELAATFRTQIKELEMKNKDMEIELYRLRNKKDLCYDKQNDQAKNYSENSLELMYKTKLETASNTISSLNSEISNMKFEFDRAINELNISKENNNKLQRVIAEMKYQLSNERRNNLMEDLAVQTLLKGEAFDSLGQKLANKEQEISSITSNLEKKSKENEKLKEKLQNYEKDNKKLADELNTILAKINKSKNSLVKECLDQDTIYNISTISRLNKLITCLKIKENEYIERIQYLEESLMEKEHTDKPFTKSADKNFPLFMKNPEENVSFNVSDHSILETKNNTKILAHPFSLKDPNVDMRKILEENVVYKEKIFSHLTQIKELHNIINNFRQNYLQIESEKNEIIKEKEQYLNHIELLKNDISQKEANNNLSLEEFQKKLNEFGECNTKVNEQLISFQNKFQVQNQLINEKNLQLNELSRENERLSSENSRIGETLSKLKEKSDDLDNRFKNLKKDYDNIKKERDSMSLHIQESTVRTSNMIKEQDEKLELLGGESEKLKELNHKYKVKLKELYEELKRRENKIEELQLEGNIRQLLQEARTTNEALLKERSQLRIELTELKIENKSLKEKGAISMGNNLKSSRLDTSMDSQLSNSILGNKKKTQNNNNREIANLKEENMQFLKVIEENSQKLSEMENIKINLELQVQTLEIEKKRAIESLSQKENENQVLKKEISILRENNQNLSNIQTFLAEINEKNQTINFLIEECDKIKKEHSDQIAKLKKQIDDQILETQRLKEDLKSTEGETAKNKERYQRDLEDLKKENQILIEELESKDQEAEKIKESKMNLEKLILKNNKEYNDTCITLKESIEKLTSENNWIKREMKTILDEQIVKNKNVKEKMNKNEMKFDKILQIYEKQISFIKRRFQDQVNELLISYNDQFRTVENFDKLLKNLENFTEYQTSLANRDAKIETFKSEIKLLNKTLKSNQALIADIRKENEIKEGDKGRKTTSKIKQGESKQDNSKDQPEKFNSLEEMRKILELSNEFLYNKLEEDKFKVTLKTKETEISFLKEQLEKFKNDKVNNDELLMMKDKELKAMQNNFNEINNKYKTEMNKYTAELSRIKEKWYPPEKGDEMCLLIANQEKSLKSLKEDVSRKKEIISNLRSQLENKETKDKKPEVPSDQSNEKIKSLNKEIQRKDNFLKDLKSNVELMKNNEKKLNDDISQLNEKLKLLKIELGRKEDLLKTKQDRIIDDSASSMNDKINEQLQKCKEKNKKLKSDLEKKDNLIKTYKNKLETQNAEIEHYKAQNEVLKKNGLAEGENKDKLTEKWKSKVDNLSNQNENLLLILKRIFKDLLCHCESFSAPKTNRDAFKFKEGLDILNLTPNELSDFMNPGYNQKSNLESYTKFLENLGSVDATLAFDKFLSLKEKLISYYQKV